MRAGRKQVFTVYSNQAYPEENRETHHRLAGTDDSVCVSSGG